MQVLFEPTAFPSGPHVYLMYELHLTNFMPMPVSLSGIDVLDADAGTSQPIATFEAAQLETMLQPLGGKTFSDPKDRLVIGDGQLPVVDLEVGKRGCSLVRARFRHFLRGAGFGRLLPQTGKVPIALQAAHQLNAGLVELQ